MPGGLTTVGLPALAVIGAGLAVSLFTGWAVHHWYPQISKWFSHTSVGKAAGKALCHAIVSLFDSPEVD